MIFETTLTEIGSFPSGMRAGAMIMADIESGAQTDDLVGRVDGVCERTHGAVPKYKRKTRPRW